MALFTPGPLVGAISGDLASINFSHGRYGPYIRKKLTRTDKHSERQYERRRALQIASTQWPEFSDELRETWRAMATTFDYRNRLGQVRRMSGYQLFCEIVLHWYPIYTDFSIFPTVLRGRSVSPQFVSATFREAGAWNVTLELPPGTVDIGIKYYLSRPVKTHALRCYHDWWFRTWRVGWNNTRIYHPVLDPDTRIDTTKAGEVVGLKMRQVVLFTDGIMIFSAPVTTAVTVV